MAVSRLSVALREIAGVTNNIFHPYVGRLLLNEDGILMQRGGMLGLRIYDELERDPRVFSVLQKRKSAINGFPWVVEGPSQRAADTVTAMLRDLNFEDANMGLGDAILKGFATGETMWARDGASIVPEQIIMRDQRRFRFDIDYVLHLVTYDNMLVGIDLPERKFIVHSWGAKDGSPYGWGIGARLYWPVFFKRQSIGFWLAFLDKFGMPTAMGTYQPGASPAEKQKLQDVLDAIAQETNISVPEGMLVSLLESQRTGQNTGYDDITRYMDEQIAEAVLGETLTTSVGDSGSRALGDVHNDVRLELVKGDGKALARTYNNSLVKWIVDLNCPGEAYPRLRFEIDEEEDLNKRAARDVQIKSLGFKPTLDYITATYGDGWEDAPPPPAFGPPGLDPRDPRAAFAELLPAQSGAPLVTAWGDRVGDTAAPAIAAMVDRIRLLAEQCGSLEELRDKLIDLYGALDPTLMAKALEQALGAADLAGHYEASISPRSPPANPARAGKGEQ
jgi:phage gp29-like protein